MEIVVAFLIAALTGLGTYAGWITRRYIGHLEDENTMLRKRAERGTALAEKGAAVAEKTAG